MILVWIWFGLRLSLIFDKKIQKGARSVQLFLSCTRLIGVGLVFHIFATGILLDKSVFATLVGQRISRKSSLFLHVFDAQENVPRKRMDVIQDVPSVGRMQVNFIYELMTPAHFAEENTLFFMQGP